MKTLIAYRHTGADLSRLESLLTSIRQAWGSRGVEAYCAFFDEDSFQSQRMGPREIMTHALKIIDDCDFLFVLLTGPEKSEGMLMEVGYCLAKGIPVLVAVKEGVEGTYLPKMTDHVIVWADQSDLAHQIATLDLPWSHQKPILA